PTTSCLLLVEHARDQIIDDCEQRPSLVGHHLRRLAMSAFRGPLDLVRVGHLGRRVRPGERPCHERMAEPQSEATSASVSASLNARMVWVDRLPFMPIWRANFAIVSPSGASKMNTTS